MFLLSLYKIHLDYVLYNRQYIHWVLFPASKVTCKGISMSHLLSKLERDSSMETDVIIFHWKSYYSI